MRIFAGIEVDPCNLPENFEEIIRNKFTEFTKGTAEEYRYVDQLRFIDVVVQYLNGPWDDSELLDNKIVEYMEDTWREYGEFVKEDDIYSREFSEACIATGRRNAELHGEFGNSPRENRAIKKMLIRIIKAIFEYDQ